MRIDWQGLTDGALLVVAAFAASYGAASVFAIAYDTRTRRKARR